MGRVSSPDMIYDAPDYFSSPTSSQACMHTSSSLRWANHCCSWMTTPSCLVPCIDPFCRFAQWLVRYVVDRVGNGEAASGARMWSRRGRRLSLCWPPAEREALLAYARASLLGGGRARAIGAGACGVLPRGAWAAWSQPSAAHPSSMMLCAAQTGQLTRHAAPAASGAVL